MRTVQAHPRENSTTEMVAADVERFVGSGKGIVVSELDGMLSFKEEQTTGT